MSRDTEALDGLYRVPMVHAACHQTITSFILASESDYANGKAKMRDHVSQCWASKKTKEDA